MGDIILGIIVAAIVFFAARAVFVKKSGGCEVGGQAVLGRQT
mgnify:CR=1 FL=1